MPVHACAPSGGVAAHPVAHEPPRAGGGVRPAGRPDRRRPPGREPVAGPARRGRDRQDRAAGVPGRLGAGPDRRAGGRRRVRDGAGLRRACTSSARRCSTGSIGCRGRSATRSRSSSASRAGPAPDRFLVGLAVLSLLSEAAEQRPLLCVVDDAQWLDQTSALTLAFVARRLLAEPVGLVFAAREPGEELRHLPELEVRGLVNGDARALLSSSVPVRARPAGARPDPRRDAGQPARAARAAPGADADAAGRRVRDAGAPRPPAADRGAATSGGSRRFPTTRAACCSSRRPSRSAIRCSCSAPASASGSRSRRSTRPTGCWRSRSA